MYYTLKILRYPFKYMFLDFFKKPKVKYRVKTESIKSKIAFQIKFEEDHLFKKGDNLTLEYPFEINENNCNEWHEGKF